MNEDVMSFELRYMLARLYYGVNIRLDGVNTNMSMGMGGCLSVGGR